MRTDAIQTSANGIVSVEFGDDVIQVPEPIAELIARHMANRDRAGTVASSENRYLFPGAKHGSHINQSHMRAVLSKLGLNVLAAKNTTLDELVAAMPAPLVADALGFSYSALGMHEKYQGSRYERYVAARNADQR